MAGKRNRPAAGAGRPPGAGRRPVQFGHAELLSEAMVVVTLAAIQRRSPQMLGDLLEVVGLALHTEKVHGSVSEAGNLRRQIAEDLLGATCHDGAECTFHASDDMVEFVADELLHIGGELAALVKLRREARRLAAGGVVAEPVEGGS